MRPAGADLISGIRVVSRPGHSVGHASLVFQGDGLRIVVAGGAAMTRAFFRQNHHYFNTVDPAAVVAPQATVAREVDVVVPGHGYYLLNRQSM